MHVIILLQTKSVDVHVDFVLYIVALNMTNQFQHAKDNWKYDELGRRFEKQ